MAEYTTPKEVFASLPTRFNKEAAKGMALWSHITCYFEAASTFST